MAIKLIAADMDGTLLNPEKRISERTVAAVQAVMREGALFVLNSGRMPEAMMRFADQLQVNAPLVCFNGALTYDAANQKAQDCIPLKLEYAREILKEAERRGQYIQGFWGSHFYYDKYTDKTCFYENKVQVKGTPVGQPLSEIIDCDAYKLLVIVNPGEMPETLSYFSEKFKGMANFAASSTTFMEIVNQNANKGEALRALGVKLNIAPEEMMAFGDELNDLSMLTMAGYGYAMENSSEAVKTQVKRIAPSNAEDGLAQILESYLKDGMFSAPGKV